MTYYMHYDSPAGRLLLTADDTVLTGVYYGHGRHCPEIAGAWRERPNHPVLRRAGVQLNEYFRGQRRSFDLPLGGGGTPFQRAVWGALLEIPYGETRSYADIARRIGHPKAVRAAGMANGANPISILVPCHRVIGTNGSLTGYAGGLESKRKLLALESGVTSPALT